MELILAGTLFLAGCTPDGACWDTFRTTRDIVVRELPAPPHPTRSHTKGFCVCDGEHPFMVVKSPLTEEELAQGWTPENIRAHESGHQAHATRHNAKRRNWK